MAEKYYVRSRRKTTTVTIPEPQVQQADVFPSTHIGIPETNKNKEVKERQIQRAKKPSAVRDFPFGTGRNIPTISKEIMKHYNQVHPGNVTIVSNSEEELEEETEAE